jgi:hypothetical protein
MSIGVFNQTCLLGTPGTPNIYSESTYTTQTIKCRKEPCSKVLVKADGLQINVTNFISTRTPISIDQTIDGKLVVEVQAVPGVFGTIERYEVYT